MAQEADWNQRIARRVGQEVARARQYTTDENGRRMSAQALADRCAELGHPLDRSVIAKLERGIRQSVSVADLLVLAKALDLPPLALVFPVGYEEEVEVLPGRSEHPVTGLRWASGEGVLPEEGPAGKRAHARWLESAIYKIRGFLKGDETVRYNRRAAKGHWVQASSAESPEARRAYEQMAQNADQMVEVQERYLEVNRQRVTVEQGLVVSVPAMYGEVLDPLLSSPGGPRSSW
ncbi:helix-turn-helix domain-containing protein [Streptomyces noursei]|uniref:helix-turn-helix domain-containing protein n=1 Tax=Streptomyces noursei TaxID=1971 RepID=UPI0035DA5116